MNLSITVIIAIILGILMALGIEKTSRNFKQGLTISIALITLTIWVTPSEYVLPLLLAIPVGVGILIGPTLVDKVGIILGIPLVLLTTQILFITIMVSITGRRPF